MRQSRLLEIDGVGNVLLGLPLLLFPQVVSRVIGVPYSGESFYPVSLGAILVGIGIALLMERFKPSIRGLGLGGAISINLTFGVVLAAWLLLTRPALPLRGASLLWGLVVVLVGISLSEIGSLHRDAS